MKKLLFIFSLSLFMCVVASCGSDEVVTQKSPAEVAVLFFSSVSSCDVENVRSNICFSNPTEQAIFDEYLERIFLPAVGKQHSLLSDSVYVVLSEEIAGDTAYVELKAATVVEKSAKFKVRLLGGAGAWKVDGSQAVLHRVE